MNDEKLARQKIGAIQLDGIGAKARNLTVLEG
jgi:hypothetical protein